MSLGRSLPTSPCGFLASTHTWIPPSDPQEVCGSDQWNREPGWVNLTTTPEGNSRIGSKFVLQDSGEIQRLHRSGTSTPPPGQAGHYPVFCIDIVSVSHTLLSFPWFIALHEQNTAAGKAWCFGMISCASVQTAHTSRPGHRQYKTVSRTTTTSSGRQDLPT